MKKLITLLLAIVSFGLCKSFGQSFSIEHDTVTASVGGSAHLYNKINNLTSGNITITWNVIASDFPTDWQLNTGMCDNALCISGAPLFAGTSYSPVYPPGLGSFYLLVDLTTATTMGTHYVRVQLNNLPDSKTQTYIVTRTPVSVSIVKTDNNVIVYPNPVINELKIMCDEAADLKKVILQDLTGKEIVSYDFLNSANQANINVENLSTGLYFVKLLNSNSEIISVNKFMKQ